MISTGSKRIARNTIFLYVRLLFLLFISLYSVRVVLASLGITDYGIYNVIGGFAGMFGFLCTTMSSAIQRFYNFAIGRHGPEAVTKVFNTAFQIQAFISLAILLAAEIIGVWYISHHMVIPADRLATAHWIYQFALFSLVLTLMQVPFAAATMAFERMDFYALVGIVDAVLKLLIAFGVKFSSSDKLWLYGFLLFAISILNFVMYVVYCKRNFTQIRFCACTTKNTRNEILAFSGWNLIGTFAYMIRNQGVIVLLNYFFGAIINAANGIVAQVAGALQTFSVNLTLAFKPQLTEAYAKGDNQRTQELWFVMSKAAYALSLTLAIPLMCEITYVLHLWLGDNVPPYTVEFTHLVIISTIIASLHTPMVQVIQATGKMKFFQIMTSILIGSILPISWVVLLCGLPPTSVYWVTNAVFVLNQGCAMYVVHRYFSYKYLDYTKHVLFPCLLFTLLLPILPYGLLAYMDTSFWRLCTVTIITMLMSLTLTYGIILNKQEKQMAKSIIDKFITKILNHDTVNHQ